MYTRKTQTHYFFWRQSCLLSNWAPTDFAWKNHSFQNAEAAFMWGKAQLFEDKESACAILLNQNPSDAKRLGRAVRNFDQDKWDYYKERIMYHVLLAKFTQHAEALSLMLGLGHNIRFVEASPYDRVWGVGLQANDPAILDAANWRGQNLLGKTLNRVRDKIIRERKGEACNLAQ